MKAAKIRNEKRKSFGDCACRPRIYALGIIAILAVSLCCFGLVGCGTQDENDDTVSATINIDGMDFEYTDRDKDGTWDEKGTTIELTGTSAKVSGDGATAEGGLVTITEEGTYILSGELSDGQIVVDATSEEKIQLVLNGASITCSDGPAIYIKQADKVFVTLAEKTENNLDSGASYEADADGEDIDATLYSKDDLTLNGSGSLAISSSYQHAIHSKDDVVITDGTYVINSVDCGIIGKDCVKICGGDFTITAAGDALRSSNSKDGTKGFVSIDGGQFAITAGDEAIQATFYVRVMDGTLNIDASDDALHSDVQARVGGGTLNINTVDDAVHAETELLVDGGKLTVSACYEGLEAEKIYVEAGEVDIHASDDAINAASAEVSTEETEDSNASEDSSSVTPAAQAPDGNGGGDMGGAGGAGGAGGPGDVGGFVPGDDAGGAGDPNEFSRNGGAPDNGFAEGMGQGMGVSDENCLISISGGTLTLESAGDTLDSNGYIEISGGTILVNGPVSDADAAFDYDLEATISGGTVLMVGSSGMAQNFTSGTQAFSFINVNGQAGDTVAVADSTGKVLVSMTAAKNFSNVLVSCPDFEEGGTYTLSVGGSQTTITASTTPSSGFGGLGADGNPMGAGQGGDVQIQSRGGFGRQ